VADVPNGLSLTPPQEIKKTKLSVLSKHQMTPLVILYTTFRIKLCPVSLHENVYFHRKNKIIVSILAINGLIGCAAASCVLRNDRRLIAASVCYRH
jgi:hypothetical protein